MLRAVPLLVVLVFLVACSSTLPNRDPVGEPFPAVTGTSLAGRVAVRERRRAGDEEDEDDEERDG
ncbi:MAG: hypothetical protein ACF8XB_12315, partial [Planctomycetota bacterium JB042]